MKSRAGTAYDAVVVGAGPNGLSAAIELARAGLSVLVREANDTVGGAARSMELTLPGFVHDPFSAIYPLAAGSPYLSRLPLADHGLEWVHSPAPLAHPFDDEPPALLERSVEGTLATLGESAGLYRRFVADFDIRWDALAGEILRPLGVPRHPILLARFGVRAILSAAWALRAGGRAAALLAGSAAHSGLALEKPASAAFALVLHASGHAEGWPLPAGGAGRLTAAMASHLESLGGRIETAARVTHLEELPASRVVLLDLTPRQILSVAGERLPSAYRDRLRRFRYGVGVFKMDWALSAPIPWRDEECRRAATVHLGGDLGEVSDAMRSVAAGGVPERPFVILAQPSLFDPQRAPDGQHTAWAYCHVPNGYTGDMSDRIESQIERFAPRFRDTILARSPLSPARLEQLNGNLVGGDVNGGAPLLDQLFFRPLMAADPYRTPGDGIFICSASTPPGGGVHGMCGFHSARSALRWLGVAPAPL